MNGIETYITPKISDVIIGGGEGIHQFDTPLVSINTTGLTPEQEFVKRFFDILLSLLTIIVFSPLYIVLAILISSKQSKCFLKCRISQVRCSFSFYI